MAKSRRTVALMLLCIGIISITLINPITGNTMDQGNMMGQGGMMGSMIGQCQGKECDTMMNACPENMTCMMMQPLIGECPANGTCYIAEQVQNASSAQTRLDCARFWLEKAMGLHELHLRDATTTTNESQIELMDQITNAFECVTGENVTSYENVTFTSDQVPADEHGHQAENSLI
jgi:hypothetical protein